MNKSSQGRQLPRKGPRKTGGTAESFAAKISRTFVDPDYVKLAAAMQAGRFGEAEPVLETLLKREPDNPLVLFQAGEFAFSRQDKARARTWYERALKLAPGYLPALYGLARCMGHFGQFSEALATTERMLGADPGNLPARLYRASLFNKIGDHEAAIDLCRGVQIERPGHYQSLQELGFAYRAAGRKDEAVQVFREVIRVAPRSGDPWFQLADLKTYRISDEDLAAMTALHQSGPLPPPGNVLLEYALGKAWYDRKDYERSFGHYLAGNRAGRNAAAAEMRIAVFERWVRNSIAAFAIVARAEAGKSPAPRPDRPQPIFIVGMPRVGSTLVEQILAAHPLIEATDELAHMEAIAHDVMHGGTPLSDINRKALAERYLERAKIQRQAGTPWFIDKLPYNYHNVALIKALLPGSRIIDVRRHPLASTVAMFRQSFAGTLADFSGSPEQLAQVRHNYARDMNLFEQALPGSVLRIHYEDLVEDLEAQIKRMLEFIGVPFDENCLRWYEKAGAVRTPSSEQVRQPIYRSALEEWRNFEPWLDRAKIILRDELADYPSR